MADTEPASQAEGQGPPNHPWKPLDAADTEIGYLAFYLSDDLAKLPVRGVTLPGNNKADPNVETNTFGLFSTCERQMRVSVVKRGVTHLFFVTRWRAQRVLTGYYRIGWYTEGAFGGEKADFALAAERSRLVEPISLSDLPGGVREAASTSWRMYKLLDAAQTKSLVELIDASPDKTDEYLDEIARLERFNLKHTGFRCWQRTEPFDWDAAQKYLNPTTSFLGTTKVPNASPTDHWLCEACKATIKNKALLKACPKCEALGALRPALADEIPTYRR